MDHSNPLRGSGSSLQVNVSKNKSNKHIAQYKKTVRTGEMYLVCKTGVLILLQHQDSSASMYQC